MDALTRDTADLQTRPETRRRRRLRKLGAWALCLLVAVAIVAVWFWPSHRGTPPASPGAGLPVPVVVAAAVQKDVPIFLEGLGTVQAFNTVTVKPMVDGPLVAVNFKEGQKVHKDEVLAQIDPRTYQAAYDQMVAKKAQDEAQLANARLDMARYQKLIANKYASEQQADTARSLVTQYEGLVRQDQAQIDNAKTQLGYTTIASPLDGRTGMRLVDQGNIVHASDTTGLVMITQLQPISVVFTLPQQTLPAVAAAMKQGAPVALAYTQAASGGTGSLLDTGRLAVLDNQVDQTTGTIKLKATFPNQQETLWPGGFVGVRLQVDTAKGAVVVPTAAIQRGPHGAYVYVTNADGTASRRAVTVGHEDEQGSIIAEGVQPGDSVVVDGASRLTDGAKVTVAQTASTGKAPASDQTAAPGTRSVRSGGPGGS
jgi:multidrug efflux system membrane fusion protein